MFGRGRRGIRMKRGMRYRTRGRRRRRWRRGGSRRGGAAAAGGAGMRGSARGRVEGRFVRGICIGIEKRRRAGRCNADVGAAGGGDGPQQQVQREEGSSKGRR